MIFNKASASYKRVKEVLAIEPHIHSGELKVMDSQETFIRFEDVSFSYQKSIALKDITFSVEAGETVGIIGGTGSGKTTLINFITTFFMKQLQDKS